MSSMYSASSGAPPDGGAAAAAAPPRIRRAMALPAAGEGLSDLSVTTETGGGVPAVTVSAAATSVGPELRAAQADRGRTGGRLFPLAGRKNTTDRGNAATDEDGAAGLPVAGVRTAALNAAQANRAAGTTAAPGSKAARPLFVAAAIAGAVLASVPFVHGKGGTVNYEGLGEARPLAELSPDADDSDAILHPDSQGRSMPLVDPAEGTAAEPLVPQPETGPLVPGGPILPVAAGVAAGEEHHEPGPAGPVTLDGPVRHPSANTNRLLLGIPGVASGLARGSELKGGGKTEPAAFSGSSGTPLTAHVGHPVKPVTVPTVTDDAPHDTTSARMSSMTASTAVTPPADTVTRQDTSEAAPPVSFPILAAGAGAPQVFTALHRAVPQETPEVTAAGVPVQPPSTTAGTPALVATARLATPVTTTGTPSGESPVQVVTATVGTPVLVVVQQPAAEEDGTPVETPVQSVPATTTAAETDVLSPADESKPPVVTTAVTPPVTPTVGTPVSAPLPAEQPTTGTTTPVVEVVVVPQPAETEPVTPTVATPVSAPLPAEQAKNGTTTPVDAADGTPSSTSTTTP